MKNLLLAAFLAAAFLSSAQSVNLNYNYPQVDTVFSWGGGSLNPHFSGARTLEKDIQGNFYVYGTYRGTTDLDPGPPLLQAPNTSGSGIYLLKLNAKKELVWARSWSANESVSIYDIGVDLNGDVFVTGRFLGTSFDADPISTQFLIGVDTLSGINTLNGFVIKLDSTGAFNWAQIVRGAQLAGLKIQSSQIVVGGSFTGGVDTSLTNSNPFYYLNTGGGIVAATLNKSTGNKLTINAYGSGSINYVNDFIVDNQGNYLFAGILLNGNFDFDPDPILSQLVSINPAGQTYCLKLSANFQYLNHLTLTSTSQNRAYRIQQIGNHYWLTGDYRNSNNIDLDPGPGVIQPSAPNNVIKGGYFLKINTNLNLIKAYYHPQDIDIAFFNSKVLSKGSSHYLMGTYKEEVFLEPSKTNGLHLDPVFQGSSTRQTSFYVIKLDNNDSIVWAYYPERLNQSTSIARIGDLIWEDDALLMVGNFSGILDFDMGSTTTATQTATNWSNFMLRLIDCTTPDSLPEVSRKYAHCGPFTINNSTLFGNRWHRVDIPLAGSQGCDSILQKDSVFVFTNPPTIADSTTFLVAEQAAGLTIEWYNCTTGQVVQSGGTRFYPQQPGNYSLIYATPDSAQNCKDTLPCQSINQISLPENEENLWKLYPNPVQETLTFSGPMRQITGLRVLQINGQEVLRLKVQKQLNLSSLAPGMYLLEISSPNGTINKKFVKE